METKTEKPSGSLLQKQSLFPEMSAGELPGVEPITINEEEFRQEFWRGRTEERGEKLECFDSPRVEQSPLTEQADQSHSQACGI